VRLIAPDLRGFGLSDRVPADAPHGPGALSMDEHADDVVALLDELGLDSAVVGGVSMGGYVTFAVLRHAASRVRGLVFCDTRADADTDEGRTNRRAMQAKLAEAGSRAIADDMVPKLIGTTTQRERPALADDLHALIEATAPEAIHDAIECLMWRADATHLLREIAVPSLIIVGREDVLTPVALHEKMHAAMPQSTLEIIDGAGHLANFERPDLVTPLIERFVASL
jgi:pimeloyl-ACP methyl ester carboxylesterase